MRGPQEPTIAYLVYRGLLIIIVSILLLATGYLITQFFIEMFRT